MKPRELQSLVEQSSLFQEWFTTHEEAFFAHIFYSPSEGKTDVQVGYLDTSDNQITTFVIEDKEIHVLPPSEYLATENPIEPLHIKNSWQSIPAALLLADVEAKKLYPKEMVLKKFLLLQVIKHVPTYNITFFTKTLQTINMKFDPQTGALREHTKNSLIDMDRGDAP